MPIEDEIQAAVKGFQRLLANERHRMAIGTAIRNHMHEQLILGVEIDHYRVDWLHKSVSRVIRVLNEIGAEFNTANPTDKFSTADMIDVAASVVATLKNHIGDD